MDRIVLVGDNPFMGTLLQIIASGITWLEYFTYRIVEIPGIGPVARKTDPLLKDASPKEAIDSADRIIAVGPLSEEIKKLLIGQARIEYLSSTLNKEYRGKPVLKFTYGKEWLPDVLQALVHLIRKGYSFGIIADSPQLNQFFHLLNRQGKVDFVISLESSSTQTVDYDAIHDRLVSFAREVVSPRRHLQRLKKQYSTMNFSRNLFSMKDSMFYLSLSRQVRVLPKEQLELLKWLEGSKKTVPKISRYMVEETAYMLLYEDWMDRRITACLNTGLAQIDNLDQVILSFPGSHLCNLRCEYCFSEHKCAEPSQMTESEVLGVCDMLTWNRPEIEIHFDNGLSGEPLLDFEQVMNRHNTTIAYHQTSGTPASFGLLTNGTRLGEEHLPWLKSHVPYVGFSLDGDKVTNDSIRHGSDGKPTYELTVRGIQRLREAGWPVETGISMVISKYNLDIKALESHMIDTLGIKNVVAKPVRASSNSDYALSFDDIEQLLENYYKLFSWINDEACKGNLKPLYTVLQPLDYAGRFLLRSFWKDRLIVKRCGCGEIIFSTADDGRVYPCDSFNGVEDHELGNLKEGLHRRSGFKVPFVHQEMNELGCTKCPLRFLCGGVCSYVKYLNNNEYNDVIRMECALSKGLAMFSLDFWQQAEQTWKPKIKKDVADHVRHIGFPPLESGALVYAPC